MAVDSDTNNAHFEKQYQSLIDLQMPKSALEQLKKLQPGLVAELNERGNAKSSAISFILMPPANVIKAETVIEKVVLKGKAGFTEMTASELRTFQPIADIDALPDTAYIGLGIDTGKETLNVTPNDALPQIIGADRSPLTVEEGLMCALYYPEVLRTQNCYSMLGSRCGDRRVTAIWVSKGRPRLGWCWAGNPHTWLGSASCAKRIS